MYNPEPAVRHELYFFPDGDTIIRVEDSVFRIHRFFLTRESNHFWSMFLTTVPCRIPPGSSESNPVVLSGATSEAFADLLWVFYNREYSIYSATLEKWKRILALARKWGFFQVEKLCVRELEKLIIPPVEKIQIYQYFNLSPDLLRSSYVALAIRAEPLEFEEGKKLGDSTSLKITRARELARGPGPDGATSSATIQLQESEIQLVVKDIFRLHGLAPAPPTATARQTPTSDDHLTVDEVVPQTQRQTQRSASRAPVSSDIIGLQGSAFAQAPTPSPPQPTATATTRQNSTIVGHLDEVVPQTRKGATVSSDIFGLQGSVSAPTPSPPQPTATTRQNPTIDDDVDEVVRQAQRGASRETVSSDMFVLQESVSTPTTLPPQPTTTDRQNPTRDDHVDEIVPQTQRQTRRGATVSSDIFGLQGSGSAPYSRKTPPPPRPTATATARQNQTRDDHVDEVVPQTRSASRSSTVSSVVTASDTGIISHPFIGFVAILPTLLLFVSFLSSFH
ncbi:hypothetical protein EDB89DRAFT_1412929 [Lactarius sanguifluus]|nr:hypothetical protein EDB89DRAFT_1412929 [Lactarius sanguifluus]